MALLVMQESKVKKIMIGPYAAREKSRYPSQHQCWKRPESLRAFDEVLRNAVTQITNTHMTGDVWHQAALPVRCGVLGLRTTEQISYSAFLASVHSVMSVVSMICPSAQIEDLLLGALDGWSTKELEAPPQEKRASQHEWDSQLSEKTLHKLMSPADMEERARLSSVCAKGSGAWLHALPSTIVGNLLNDDELRIAVALRLGAGICQEHVCPCGSPVNRTGRHGLNCSDSSAGRFAGHGAINDVVHRGLISAGIPNVREPSNMFNNDGKRPDGKTMVPYSCGRCMTWDVTVVDSLAMRHLASAARASAKPAEDAEEEKRIKSKELERQYLFCPLGFETCGATGPSAAKVIKEIERRITERSEETRATEFLRQRISIEIQRGNAACVVGSLPKTLGLHEVFNVSSSK